MASLLQLRSQRRGMATIVQSAMCNLGKGRQRPSLFFVPSLRAAPVWSVDDLPDANQRRALLALSAAAPELLAEYDAMRSAVPSDYPARQDGEHRLHEGAWDWHSYLKKGERQPDFAARCPATASLLEGVPGLMGGGCPFGFAFFSTLHAGSTIAPHTSPCNLRVRVHLPLRVPAGECGMDVAGTPLRWREGQLLLFDDSYEHHVWNRAGAARVLLLLDLWHPGLSQGERAEVQEMFARARAERQAAR